MEPKKYSPITFRDNGRVISSPYKLFDHVFKVCAYTTVVDMRGNWNSKLILDEVAFLHICEGNNYYINENGYCTNCGKFLATHKKLEVMAGLKELND